MIKLANIVKRYRGKPVVDDLSVTLPTERIIAFIGSNGAGKSTVLSIISRLLAASEGQVDVDGKNLAQWNSRELAKRLAILSQTAYLATRLTVEDLVRFGRFPHSQGRLTGEDRRAVEQALEYTEMADLRGRFLDELSGGQRQTAYIAMAVAQDTRYILLDEPLNNLDMRRSVKIMKLLRKLVDEKRKTILIVIHDINFVSFHADYIVALKDGKLRHTGEVDAIITPAVLKDIYDMDIAIENYGGKKICVYYE